VVSAGGLAVYPASLTLQGATTYTFTNLGGDFRQDVMPGTYTLTVTMNGYEPYTEAIIVPQGITEMQHDITLIPVQGPCNIVWPPVLLSGSVAKCRLEIRLTWTYGCENKVASWTVYRDNQPIYTTSNQYTNSYTDTASTQLSWDKTYSYYVVAQHSSGQNKSNTLQISAGTLACEGICGSEEFCLPDVSGLPSVRARCSDQNTFTVIQDCSLFSSTCVGPDASGSTYCRGAESCENLGVPGNLLGMYFDQNTCISDGSQPRYCYYDFSNTTVDSCKSCFTKMFCYDYRSDGACSIDNCKVTRNGKHYDCTWYEEIQAFSELGKGVCFAPQYDGNEYCTRCGEKNKLFANVHCSPTMCDLLGACYKNTTDECIACKNPPGELFTKNPSRCELFHEMRSCVGSSGIVAEQDQEFSIPSCTGSARSSDSFVYSNDACSLGVCKWNQAAATCFKDGNDDDKPDCSAVDITCQRDTQPPVTQVTIKPAKVNRNTDGKLSLSISDYGWGATQGALYNSYFCVDLANQCCPDTRTTSKDLILKGDGSIPSLVNVEGTMYFRFFSVDGYNNTEPIKNVALNVDTKPPKFTITYTLTNTSGTADRADLTLRISVSEPVMGVSDKLQNVESSQSQSKITQASMSPASPRIQVYSSLVDGFYLYSITAKDNFGNDNTTEIKYISIDRIHMITNASPVGKRFLPGKTISLSITTIDSYDCFYQQRSPTAGSRTRFAAATKSGAFFNYKTVVTPSSSGYYQYDVDCGKGGSVVDRTILFFTVDGIPPRTSLYYEDYIGHFIPFAASSWYSSVKAKFECNDTDPLLSHTPGPWGCSAIYYCTDTTNSCKPNKKLPGSFGFVDFSTQPSSFYIRYFSADNGGNNETTKSQFVRIDKQAPTIVITYPANGTVINNPSITLRGTWSDASASQVDITVAIATDTGGNQTTFTSSAGSFSIGLTLSGGKNTISVIGKDTGVIGPPNIAQSQIVLVYYDTVGPSFSNVKILNHKNERIDDLSKKAEYSKNIKFIATITDNYWTKNVTLARLTVECINQSICSSYRNTFTMLKNQSQFSYLLSPTLSGILRPGKYLATYYAEDRFANSNRYNQTFLVADTSSLTGMVFNHLGKRIDSGTESAEYGERIVFVAKPSNLNISSSASVLVRCISIECGTYSRSFAMTLGGKNYSFVLDPLSSGALLPGRYNATVSFLDLWGKIRYDELSFVVKDTSKLNAKVFNYLGLRIDDGSHKAEYGKELRFNVSSSDPSLFTNLTIIVACANSSACGSFRQAMPIVKNGTGYRSTLVPAKDSRSIYQPDIGRYNALFILQDRFGMFRTILKNFTIVDSGIAPISITVETTTFNAKGQPKVGIGQTACKWYRIIVTSVKPMDIQSLKAEIFRYGARQPPAIDFANLPVPQVSPNRDQWTYQLCVPYENPVYMYLRGNNTRFLIDAVDIHGLHLSDKDIISGRFFEIDTHGGDPPVLFTKIPKDYYTTQSALFIAGTTSPQEPSFQVYMNLSGTLLQTTASPIATKLGEDSAFLALGIGATTLDVSGNKVSLFSVGRYVQFAGHNRSTGLYYSITSSQFSLATQTTRITLQPAIEKPVKVLEKVMVYDRQEPTGYFTFTTTLSRRGNTSLSIWAVDELGNIGLPAERTIIYDNQPFTILSYSPHNLSAFPEKRVNITAMISDDSPINLSSIKLTVNNQTFTCTKSLKCKLVGNRLTITLVPTADMPDGTYSIRLEGEDILHNRNVFSWEFRIDSTAPVLLLFEVMNGNYYPAPLDRWYTSSTPLTIHVEFEKPVANGTIGIKEVPGLTFLCSGMTALQMTCAAQGTLPEGKYTIVGTAQNNLGTRLGATGKFRYFVTIDTTSPIISFNPTLPSRQRDQSVSGHLSERNMDPNDIVRITGMQLISPVDAIHDNKTFTASVTLSPVQEGNYTILGTAYDKAGNFNTATATLIYDLSCTPITITSLDASNKNRTVVKTGATYYITNVGTLAWGIMTTGFAEAGTLRVYTSYKSTGNVTTKETLQRTLHLSRAFRTNVTLGQANGENFVLFVATDLAGNNCTALATIKSDVTGPASPGVLFEKGMAPLAQIGSTGWPQPGPPQAPDLCTALVTEVERDSCLINLLLNGNNQVCSYISNYYLRVSCEAVP
jgi:hypothetical protein